ncbi:calcineurin B homologous protein 2-like isoform X1 [Dromaius novaehollandiae]|uniref:calcineurin B homologous protein 2-like isoform X1 n=1 Tax=Dromaius novaehollandiae TaxID=8790 RepID=UPI00311EF70D
MGAAAARPPPGLGALAEETGLSPAALTRLHERFQALDRDDKGHLRAQQADFATFARVLAHFRPAEGAPSGPGGPGSPGSKLRFVFQLYDLDGDGQISYRELLQVLRLMVGLEVPDEALAAVAARALREADRGGRGALCFDDFAKAMERLDVDRRMSIWMLK